MISVVARLNLAVIGFVVFVAAVVGSLLFSSHYSFEVVTPAYCTKEPAPLALAATAAYAEDLATGEILYEQNGYAQLPLASLTKLMTVLTAASLLPPERVVTVTRDALEPEGDAGLMADETWKLEDLVDFTLMSSVNDGARTLALAAASDNGKDLSWFIQAMNEKASLLGLSRTFFLNDTGLDVSSTTAGAYGSAEDVVRMLAYAVSENPRLVEGSTVPSRTFVSLDHRVHDAENTSGAGIFLENASVSKTGFTDLAGGNLAIVFEPFLGRPVAAAVLGSTREERDADIAKVANAAKKELRKKILCDQFRTR